MENNSEEMSIKSEEVKDNNNFDLIDIVERNNKNIIYLKKKNDIVKINPKSIYKILSLLSDETQDLSDVYIDHITINIITPKAINKYMDSIENIDLEINNSELDDKYINILNDAKKFYINLNSDKNKNIFIFKNSLIKIFNYLNKSIIDNSDYINLVILYLKNESKNELAKLTIEQKILKKYKSEKIIENFNGIKKYNLNLKVPLQSESQNIYELDNYFNKIVDFIDDYEQDSSFSDKINGLSIPRKTLDENLIKVVNVSFIEEGIFANDFDNDNEINNQNEDYKKYSRKSKHSKNPSNVTLNNENICNKNLCNGMCNIY